MLWENSPPAVLSVQEGVPSCMAGVIAMASLILKHRAEYHDLLQEVSSQAQS